MTQRETNLIAKGGQTGADLGGKSEIFYNANEAKLKATMKKLDTSVPKIARTTSRNG